MRSCLLKKVKEHYFLTENCLKKNRFFLNKSSGSYARLPVRLTYFLKKKNNHVQVLSASIYVVDNCQLR